MLEVITQDVSSGRVHLRLRRNGVLYDSPQCNLERDTAGAYRILTRAEFEALPFDARCRRCWPEDDPTVERVDPA